MSRPIAAVAGSFFGGHIQGSKKVGEQLVVEPNVIEQKPVGSIAIARYDRVDDLLMLLIGTAQGLRPIELIRPVWTEAIVQGLCLFHQVAIMRAGVDRAMKVAVHLVIGFAVAYLHVLQAFLVAQDEVLALR